jgi:EAL domain-containing protein (putative c-di-GMP-specific phosphodiesterase class I)
VTPPVLPAARSLPAPTDALARALEPGAIHSAYQPIVDLATDRVLAVEALARGPRGPLAMPDALFAAARATGRLPALEARCTEAAIAGALRAGLDMPLFVNLEPDAVDSASLAVLRRGDALAAGRVPLVLEITERSLTARPAELIDMLARARGLGWSIALDDVGADPRSLALMPIVRPDVIKLDRGVVQSMDAPATAALVTAIAAECERTGALVLAEGIETEEQRRAAMACGATLGQGWLFGRPGPLADGSSSAWRPPSLPPSRRVAEDATPYGVVAAHRPVSVAGWTFLLQISLMLEARAAALGPEAVIVSAFQDDVRFTPATAVRYEALADAASFVAALAVGLDPEPAPGVRGSALPPDHPLRGEWSVVVLGSHFAGALVASEIPGSGTGRRADFAYAVTYDRDLVIAAATSLMRQVARAA